jgi:hypothetical protein
VQINPENEYQWIKVKKKLPAGYLDVKKDKYRPAEYKKRK